MSFLARWLLAAVAASPAIGVAQSLGLQLRLDAGLRPPTESELSRDAGLVFIEAESVEGTTGQRLAADGAVRLRMRGRSVFADSIRYDTADEVLTATGNVRVDRLGDVLEGDRVRLDMRKDTAYAESPEYYFRQLNARGKARTLFVDGRSRVRADDATYSTCAPPDQDWYLKVRRLDLDREKDEGVARSATVYFKDVPFLYTPYIDFPLSNARKSGFLGPTYGTTGKSGFEFTVPYYLNLAPNYDATIAPRFLAKRGVMLNNEVRYLGAGFNGVLNAEFLPNDRERGGERRYALAFRHNQAVSPALNAYANLQKASDDLYFVDLSNRLAVTSLSNLPREVGVNYNGGWWNLGARTQKFQTLQDPKAPIVPPYARMPQVTLTALKEHPTGTDLSLSSEAVYFSHPTLLSGRRLTLYPSVTHPVQTAYAVVMPKIGLNYTRYDLDTLPGQPSTLDRLLPVFSVDSTLTFERSTSFLGTPLLQTLEPRLYYVYIPYRDQSRFPVFDTTVADFNLAQVYSENQFIGGDRINDANQLTAGVSSRFIDALDGRERLRLTLAQRFFFADQRVTLPNTVARTQNRSDVLAAVTGRMSQSWYADATVKFDLNAVRPDRTMLLLRYNPDPGRVLNFGYRYNRSSFEQVDVSGQWFFDERWSGVGRFAYSLFDRRATTKIAGIEYNAGCWVGRFVLQEFVTFTQDSVRAFFFQLELNGLSRLGSNPLEILRQNVTGYQRLNTLPQSQFNEDYYPAQ